MTVFCLITSLEKVEAQLKYAAIDTTIRAFMIDRKIPGFIAGIVNEKGIEWSNAYGLADLSSNIPMNMDGIMNIGSVSKTFTTMAAMQLWEKGLLDLNADVNRYLDVKIVNPMHSTKPITVFQILTHTSSICDGKAYAASYACGDPQQSLNNWVRETLVAGGRYYNGGDNFTASAPGQEQKYANMPFGLLGLIIEKIAQQPFNIYCKHNIFLPLGMENTGWFLQEIDRSRHITPYAYVTEEDKAELLANRRLYSDQAEFKLGTFVPNCLYSFPNYPDGLLHTSVRELSFYVVALLNGGELNGKRILKKQTVEKMLSLQLADNTHQGLTWHTRALSDGTNLWGHSGGDPGITTFLFFNPIDKIGVITFQNAATGGTFPLIVNKLYNLAKPN
ncbi:serine hydrolase domain-containing protein [Spirosoma endbachense]|nr:serine hydrolase domain-containing protein [Spirosoma endbachense]